METVYEEIHKLLTKEQIDTLLNNKMWITAQRVRIPVKQMSTYHIKNCIKCWQGKGKMKIPIYYLGGKDKWLDIFHQELLSRQ